MKSVLTIFKYKLLLILIIILSAIPALSQIIIKHDNGGSIEQKIVEINSIDENVIIDGFCASSCTMMLKIACVTPNSTLLFHGPSSQFYGIGLPKKDFEKWSAIMADYYPPKIKEWFMNKARYITVGGITMTGKEAIKLGARKCN